MQSLTKTTIPSCFSLSHRQIDVNIVMLFIGFKFFMTATCNHKVAIFYVQSIIIWLSLSGIIICNVNIMVCLVRP